MSDWRVTLDRIRPSPEKKVTRFQIVELERIILATNHGLEGAGAPNPDILSAGIARNIANAVLREHVIDETGAIHSAVGRIGGTVFVVQIAGGELESGCEKLLYSGWITVEVADRVGRQTRIRRAAFFFFR